MSKSSAKRLAVVVSQGQSKNPQKRDLEENIITGLMFEPGIDVTVVPHLYDLKPDGTGLLAMQGIRGDVVVCSWLFERAAHWVLDRNGIRGHVGTTLIKHDSDEDLDDDELDEEADDDKSRVVDSREIPNRRIFCLDLKVHSDAKPYIEEVKRIQAETQFQLVSLGGLSLGGAPSNAANPADASTSNGSAATNGHAPTNGHVSTNGHAAEASAAAAATDAAQEEVAPGEVQRVEESGGRRWYPVIDYSRCTNCMECIDFCLFGVYGIDSAETILVEQPDNCRKGCPACSRVCPENAIMFPQHKTPAIAGSDDAVGGLKIDLSRLFGAPEAGKDAIDVAVLERDEQLLQAGREAVGHSLGIPKRQAGGKHADDRDEMDDLIDQLDDLDL